MHFPKYWARGEWIGTRPGGQPWKQLAWDCSDESPADAQARAHEKARRLGENALRTGAADNEYPYANRPLREPVLRAIDHAGPECAAAVTRSAYGSEMLNTERLMFVDVDLPRQGAGRASGGLFARLLRLLTGKPSIPTPHTAFSTTEGCLAILTQWQASNPSWAFRAYRTHSGLRYLVSSAWQDPVSDLTHKVLSSLGCDPRYQQLCRVQKSFRARLTPKPYRCGLANPPVSFPFTDLDQQRRMDEWVTRYQKITARFATCQYLCTIGRAAFSAAISALITEHDRQTKADSNLPLA
jgi:hypothetical protein